MMRMLAVAFAVAITVAITVSSAGCGPECRNLTDCSIGFICNVDGVCIEECPSGDVEVSAFVTAPDQVTEVAGEVSIDGGPFQETDAAGALPGLQLPSGRHTFTARRGDFVGETSVELCGGAVVRVAVPVRPPPGTVGIVDGIYDDIEDVLAGMGFVRTQDYESLNAAEIASPGELDRFRYIFINCGHSLNLLDTTVTTPLAAWVRDGGALYASDLAFDVVDVVFPGHAVGGGGGNAGVFVAEVLDESLSEHLGKTAVELDYNLSAWQHVESVSAGTTELVRGIAGEVDDMPLLFQFREGEGRVTYTTFHNEAQTTADMDRILSYLVFSL